MKRAHWTARTALALALIGSLVPQRPAVADGPGQRLTASDAAPAAVKTTNEIADVALGAGGVFSGQVVDAQGRPLPGSTVTVSSQGHVVAQATADSEGRFSIADLQGGMYQVVAGQETKFFRLWAPQTAPPAAGQSALLVGAGQVVRGQGALRYWLTNPWVLAVGVAAAIAVPIALSNREKSSTS